MKLEDLRKGSPAPKSAFVVFEIQSAWSERRACNVAAQAFDDARLFPLASLTYHRRAQKPIFMFGKQVFHARWTGKAFVFRIPTYCGAPKP